MAGVPDIRIRPANDARVNASGSYVLYWMTAARRAHYNFALQRAAEYAAELKKPLVVIETIFSGLRWDSERFHKFALDGVADNTSAFEKTPAAYGAFVEKKRGEAATLIAKAAAKAAVVVADEFPCGQYPAILSRAGKKISVLVEAVDSNGLLPLRAAERVFTTAYSFRRFLQKELPAHLAAAPRAMPLSAAQIPPAGKIAPTVAHRCTGSVKGRTIGAQKLLERLAIDHNVKPVEAVGGERAAQVALKRFIKERLSRYMSGRNEPEGSATSELSAYLHSGHISAHEVAAKILAREKWTPKKLSKKSTGHKSGWWGVSEDAGAFLDQLVTWRELGFNMSFYRDDYDEFGSLPFWARDTLAAHAKDKREYVYGLDEFERAATHDELWNAAQRQLVREGVIHNYLRMLWGKKILEWSPSPEDALAVMVELNNKYALDGRDPNSYSGIFWVLGRYDRAWGPERNVFGKIRYMSSGNTARKVRVRGYLQKYKA